MLKFYQLGGVVQRERRTNLNVPFVSRGIDTQLHGEPLDQPPPVIVLPSDSPQP